MREVITHFPGVGMAWSHFWFESQDVLVRHPGRISQLLYVRFRVVRLWPVLGAMCSDGQRDLERWPVGTIGMVVSLNFDADGWRVTLEHDDDQLGAGPRWPEIRLEHFLHCTEPLNGPVTPGLPQEAANDA